MVTYVARAIYTNMEAQKEFNVSWIEGLCYSSTSPFLPTLALFVVPAGLNQSFILLYMSWAYLIFCFVASTKSQREMVIFSNMFGSYFAQSIVGLAWNLTESYSEKKLKEAIDRVTESNQLKTKFISWLSHDLRTPLVGLGGFCDELKQATNLNAVQRELVAGINGCADSISGLITHLLDFSTMESRKLTLRREMFNLPNTMQFLASLLVKSAQLKFQHVEQHIDSKFFADSRNEVYRSFFWGDGLRLQQCVNNLVSNAVKYTPEGGNIKLSFDLISSNEKEVSLSITVSDSGIGIPEAETKKIFEPFYQVQKRSEGTQTGGIGIGLFIVSEIVKAMSGTIQCKPAGTMGTTFTISTTLQRVSEFEYQEESRKQNATYWTPQTAAGVHVLLVEDNPVNQTILKKLVANIGFKCTVVNNGLEAVNAFRDRPSDFTLILMDLQMPQKDGFQATEEIRALEKQRKTIDPRTVAIPIIALTASTFPDELARALKVGMNEVLCKPLTNLELCESTFRVLATLKRKRSLPQ